MESPTAKPSTPRETEATTAPSQPYELYVAFGVSLIPHAAALVLGGYGRIITNAPLAVIVTIVDLVAVVIAYLAFRDDTHAHRSSHWVVWATLAAGAIWLLYAVFVGVVILFSQIFCVSQNCRGPIH
jgi:hypothetical protein